MALSLYTIAFQAMGGPGEIRLYAEAEARAREAAAAAIGEIQRIEAKYSRYRDDSVVCAINRGAGAAEPVPVDEETRWLLDYAEQLHRSSGGRFDITSGVLRSAWDFKAGVVPDPERLEQARRRIGWDRVWRDEAAIRLPEAGMELDFGGFGKEYAADRAAERLLEAGIRHGYVNLAGDIRVAGPRPEEQPAWLIGIQDPRQRGAIVATIPLTEGALATSGDYERFFEQDGRRYCHILDPGSGLPVTHWRSVTLLAPRAIVAGGCATIAMLLQEGAPAFLEQSGLPYLAIDQAGRLHRRGDRAG